MFSPAGALAPLDKNPQESFLVASSALLELCHIFVHSLDLLRLCSRNKRKIRGCTGSLISGRPGRS